ncbi:arylsulfatase [Leptospira inadai serovar Lyme str. 10]|uniref:Arylsulfatase n=2 Tax=Leptospira inadai serovar Lyme TaxID=293084 RepID=V6HB04_9LEPT|nr:LTA synthase family protein [Leptospira inadai]EQA36482.1 arylsulfatase [Leptospira inadai serovar Lyme str. 10]PNV75721.1 alkaline phosphatase [Leptospira inadai serovar Lyme]
MKRIPPNLKIIGFYSAVIFSLLTIFRIVLFLLYFGKIDNSPWGEVLLSFLIGVRFDLSVTAITVGPFWLLSGFYFGNRWKFYRYIWGIPPIILVLWMFGHLIGDTIYYGEANKHLGYEGFVFLGKDFFVILTAALQNTPALVVSGLLIIFFGLPLFIWSFVKWNGYRFSAENKKAELIQIPISILVVFLLFRGGIQSRPLRSTEAIHSQNGFLNNLPLNGVFTTLMDLKSTAISPNLRLSHSESLAIVKKEIDYPGANFTDDRYPILRETKETRQGTPPNIVIILLESWTGKFIRPNGTGLVGGKELTPNFNSLISKGKYFPHFFATGGRTTNGLLSVLTGIPDRPGITVIRTHQVLGNFGGLGTVLKQAGYNTLFVHGGDIGFDNMSFLFPHWGFESIVGREEMRQKNEYTSGAWGYFDEDVLDELQKRMSVTKPPFLAVSLTLTTHYPYEVPEKEFEIFPNSVQDYDYFNTYHYSDWALGKFIEKVRKSPYFDNTIFVFVADHTHHRNLNPYEDRNIPLLLYSPKLVKPGIDNRISSQLDVLPTILGLVGKKLKFSAMGRDLLSDQEQGRAYFAFSSVIGWIERGLSFYRFTDGDVRDATPFPPEKKTNFCESSRSICDEYETKAKAFFNLSYELLNSNSIYPPKEK